MVTTYSWVHMWTAKSPEFGTIFLSGYQCRLPLLTSLLPFHIFSCFMIFISICKWKFIFFLFIYKPTIMKCFIFICVYSYIVFCLWYISRCVCLFVCLSARYYCIDIIRGITYKTNNFIFRLFLSGRCFCVCVYFLCFLRGTNLLCLAYTFETYTSTQTITERNDTKQKKKIMRTNEQKYTIKKLVICCA